jgi:hypothetical protein
LTRAGIPRIMRLWHGSRRARRPLTMQQLVLSIDDEELLSRLEGEAQRQGKPLQDLVLEALDWWMRAMEVAQDLTDSEIALEEYESEEGIDAFEYFRQRARSAPLQG